MHARSTRQIRSRGITEGLEETQEALRKHGRAMKSQSPVGDMVQHTTAQVTASTGISVHTQPDTPSRGTLQPDRSRANVSKGAGMQHRTEASNVGIAGLLTPTGKLQRATVAPRVRYKS